MIPESDLTLSGKCPKPKYPEGKNKNTFYANLKTEICLHQRGYLAYFSINNNQL